MSHSDSSSPLFREHTRAMAKESFREEEATAVSTSTGHTAEASEKCTPEVSKKNALFRLLQGPYAYITTVIVAFCESFFFPIPPDIGLATIIIANPEKAWRLAFHCTIASVLGGIVGYSLGMFLFEKVGLSIIDAYGLSSQFDSLKSDFNIYGFWILMFKGFTPIPFKLLTIASGVFHMPFGEFIFAAIVARTSRLFLVAFLLKKYGHHVREVFEKSFGLMNVAVIAGIILSFVLVKYMF